MINRKVKNFITTLCFLIVFLLAFQVVTHVFRQKAGRNDTIGTFYDQEKDSLDVLFLGSSHSYRTFNPMDVWDITGITSYNMGTFAQSIPCSYYLLKDGIIRQHPKVVVLEAYGAVYMADYYDESRLHYAFDGMPLNRTKVEMLTELLPYSMEPKEIVSIALPLIGMHGKWESLKQIDFFPDNQFMKGYQYIEQVEPLNKAEKVTDCGEIYDRTFLYLDKIIELCRETDTELIVTLAPMADSEYYESICLNTNTLLQHAKEQGVTCLDLNDMADELGIEYDKDFYNSSHLNAHGGKKCSIYMADYLVENYGLTNHKGDPNYASWDEDFQKYVQFVTGEYDVTQDDGM